jgi:hypothetical protein
MASWRGALRGSASTNREGENLLRESEDEDKEIVLEILKAECEVFPGRPERFG